MAAAAPIPAPAPAADDEIVYESMPCIRIYKNRVERYFGSEFVAASADADAATGVASRDRVISPEVSARLYLPRIDAAQAAAAGFEPWLADHADFARLYLGGESAGANIAHHVAMRVGAEGLPHAAAIHGLLMIHPFVEGAPGLDALACGRVLVCIGEGDVLRDRGRAYYDRLRASGWPGEADIWQAPGKGHTFHLLEPCCEEAVAQDKVIAEFLNH
ncbi:unnamed protein product [Triticum turgidum subsp. durum]|uniref:Alpha/beta hydrolase fold-3 domain-containing protein n=1 Tax=Triticum turgidum subsp. durum TaxID=4567 RepID=A0A9R1ARX2_TRITD|nr:unnamed protein product [Triticum turgidum subsp. durum]